MTSHLPISITDASTIGEARRAMQARSAVAGLGDADAGRAAIIATELATNLTRHVGPGGGTMLLWAEPGAVEVTSLDTGPGMGDVSRCFADGFSTGVTPGNGLGTVARMSDDHDLFSAETGTVLWCRVVAGGGPGMRPMGQPSRSALRFAGLSVAVQGETVCGDAWHLARAPAATAADAEDRRVSLIVADGLGHGPGAAQASAAACAVYAGDPFAAPEKILEIMHARIGGTRGAAVSIAQVDPAVGQLAYAGVGNIAGTLIAPDGASRGLFSHNGTVGHLVRKIQTFAYPWAPGARLILHSDGLQTRWTLDRYPGLARRHPAVIAGVLYRDFRRGRDDATVVVIGPPQP